jgi:hypothetical protein
MVHVFNYIKSTANEDILIIRMHGIVLMNWNMIWYGMIYLFLIDVANSVYEFTITISYIARYNNTKNENAVFMLKSYVNIQNNHQIH